MKISLSIITVASVLLPGLAAAAQDPFDAYVERMIQDAHESGAVVNVESHSSVSTGGQVAGAGQTVVTDGDVSASSHTETRINAGNDGGSVYVKTETSKNGETEVKEYMQEIEPGEPVEVNVAAKASNESAESTVEIQGETMAEITTTGARESVEAEISVATRVEAALKSVPSFLRKIFDLVKFW